MRLLLDTHIAIWAFSNDQRLSRRARELIGRRENDIVVSVVTLWEITIKHSLAKRRQSRFDLSGEAAMRSFIDAGFELLSITAEHALAVQDLPFHHRDPFDRMLVAQALSEPMNLVTHDAQVAAYSPGFILV